MRWILSCAALAGLAAFGFVQTRAKATYWLKTETVDLEHNWKSGADIVPNRKGLSNSQTTYTLYRKTGGASQQVWRVVRDEKPIHTWLSDSGEAWVLADTTSIFGGPMGGRSELWARGLDSKAIGDWRGDFLHSNAPNVYPGMAAALDLAHSGIEQLGTQGSEKFTLAFKDGTKAAIDVIETQNSGSIKLIRHFAVGQSKDPLESLARSADRPLIVNEELPTMHRFRVWNDPFQVQKPVLEVDVEQSMDLSGSRTVQKARTISAVPAYVAPTPYGKIAWFEFTQSTAKLLFLDLQGTELSSVDLLHLGKYTSAEEAKSELQYRDIRALGPNGLRPLDQQMWSSGATSEKLVLDDSNGRQFIISAVSKEEGLAVDASISYLSDRIPVKEPVIPGAILRSEKILHSNNGTFKLRVRDFEVGGTPRTQLTLLTSLNDPVKGAKDVELWSAQVPIKLAQIRVSESGRVYGLMDVQKGSIPSKPDLQMAMLCYWDVDGKASPGFDVAGTTLKWFASPDEAIKEMDLSKMRITLEGDRSEREVGGVQIPSWKGERLDFTLPGQTKTLYVSRIGDMLPMFTLRPN